MTRSSLAERGLFKIAVPVDAWQELVHRPDSNHFDYDLLDRFASDLGVSLRATYAESPDSALRQLHSGWADAAVLPYRSRLPEGVRLVAPCRVGDETAGGESPPTLAVYTRSDSLELVELFDGIVPRLARAEGGGGFFEHYCFEQSFARAERDVETVAHDIAHYARVMAKAADEVGLDWKLVAALIYEESGFQVRAVSTKGARGLMQLMPWIPGEVGIRSVVEPEANIRAGVLYLGRLADMFPSSNGQDRLAVVLASYLLGPGHVLDAQEIARRSGLDPEAWHGGLEAVLPLLESPSHYSATRAGYAQGRHAVAYVNRILERYEAYKRQIGLPTEQTARVVHPQRPA